jgi:hypothetical protein
MTLIPYPSVLEYVFFLPESQKLPGSLTFIWFRHDSTSQSSALRANEHGKFHLHYCLLTTGTDLPFPQVRFLLAKYPHCVNEPDHAGRTALHYAAADANGEHMASFNGMASSPGIKGFLINFDISQNSHQIKVLQKAGGDAFMEDKYGHTPFYYRTHGRGLNIRTLKDNAVSQKYI